MNGSKEANKVLTDMIAAFYAGDAGGVPLDVVVCPATIHLLSVFDVLSAVKPKQGTLTVAAQNVYSEPKGAFTGETSCGMLVDAGISQVMLGHSERRHVFGETDEMMASKIKACLSAGLNVIACIGEKKEEREGGTTMEVCAKQLAAFKEGAGVDAAAWDKIVIAYEPVWAIGTGLVATPDMAQATHAEIRAWCAAELSPEIAAKVRIVYGGSVKSGNCVDLGSQPDIDGFLIGGASLTDDFAKILTLSKDKA
jgi:triosephosphate isomerase